MKVLSVQVQPELASGVDEGLLIELLQQTGAGTGLVKRVGVSEGKDQTRYINVNYMTEDLPGLWGLVRRKVLESPTVGPILRKAVIVVCQGESGWDDYLLLHHFNVAEPLDSLPD